LIFGHLAAVASIAVKAGGPRVPAFHIHIANFRMKTMRQ